MMMQGGLVNIPKNMLLVGAFDQNTLSTNPGRWLAYSVYAAIVSYPLLTIQRRLECQSDRAGMIRPRYSGAMHAFNVIRKEEGLKGFYRGFGAYAVVNGLITYISFRTMMEFLMEGGGL